jgi:hypothetical protein
VDATRRNRPGWSGQHRQVTDRDATVGQHHRDVAQHPARRMRRAALPPGTDHNVERLGDIRRAATSASSVTDTRADTLAPGHNPDLRKRRDRPHLRGAFLVNRRVNLRRCCAPKINSVPQQLG